MARNWRWPVPDLDFQVTGVEPSTDGLTPLLQFKLRVTNSSPEPIHALLLGTQIQIQSPQRSYTADEKEKLVELFGTPERWGQTLRNRLWTHANATVGRFIGETETLLPVHCSYDLNLAAAKYFYALGEGDVPLLFLFSGSVFYATPEKNLQVERVSWNKECAYRLPVRTLKALMERHYPNSQWVYLHRETFDRLWAYKRRQGLAAWEQVVEQLLSSADCRKNVVPTQEARA
jgi:Family of unknown function (DUF6084)